MNEYKAIGLKSGKGETMEVHNMSKTLDTTKAHWSAE
jgi:hypothetical protein